ncbi:pyridine nucleotide-disulfide oxidoreductase [Mycobacterium sp. CBMA293]|uniref:NAD(P)/FAD-dependent oxidoreductase n=1 Tax=unclassified Mycolicibacterium TaxID=2636767 RepID=UPI0012DCF374|nr:MULTISPECIES: NAD(P)/FAD-dependent oxidoreductase [unclassified Mycolicibacterium]MUL45235.1 pyridine nucleotide-disulfide oxidoreductase [Mycolicibacterium sp. CBMA 360]MUL56755.1 pyridine nucleotide-disulfide oxidoreductase [Mycolicibacterium sp. CBMA 335]MUL69794.1 pyridine nucleotide-disulfide oxidoreductase [Mycolicibacterium sp. CBMA 311]MUL91842.1 pyridine nucleotide-disulfide oxidoreductase [Mycolicibacterium sp. CBMA 230]MUM05582.1 pyridine nucleotide-disulfide oxidoreductase [Myco
MTGARQAGAGEVRLYGDARDARGYELRDFLQRSVVQFEWFDLTADPAAAAAAGLAGVSADNLPVCEFPDGTRLSRPTVAEVAARLGWINQPRATEYDLSIYGAGPAGLSAAVYAASEGLSTIVVERHAVGGQAGTSSRIENFLGFPGGISGADLAERARQQAVAFGAEILLIREGIHAVFADGRIHVDLADGGKLIARSNICATGVEYRRLNVSDEQRFVGRGVYYGAATSEAPLCRSEQVVVVGGGNSAGQAAMYLSEYAAHVVVLIRGSRPADSMSDYLLSRLQRAPTIDIRTAHEIVALRGDDVLESVVVRDLATAEQYEIQTGRVFVLVGGAPNTDWARDTAIIRDPAGYLVTGPDLLEAGCPPPLWPLTRQPYYLETSVPGSFAVGDVRHSSVKRVASAVGEGAMAVQFVHRFLADDDTG